MQYANLHDAKPKHVKKHLLCGALLGVSFILGVLLAGKLGDIKHRSQMAVKAYYADDADHVIVVEHTIIVTPSPSPKANQY